MIKKILCLICFCFVQAEASRIIDEAIFVPSEVEQSPDGNGYSTKEYGIVPKAVAEEINKATQALVSAKSAAEATQLLQAKIPTIADTYNFPDVRDKQFYQQLIERESRLAVPYLQYLSNSCNSGLDRSNWNSFVHINQDFLENFSGLILNINNLLHISKPDDFIKEPIVINLFDLNKCKQQNFHQFIMGKAPLINIKDCIKDSLLSSLTKFNNFVIALDDNITGLDTKVKNLEKERIDLWKAHLKFPQTSPLYHPTLDEYNSKYYEYSRAKNCLEKVKLLHDNWPTYIKKLVQGLLSIKCENQSGVQQQNWDVGGYGNALERKMKAEKEKYQKDPTNSWWDHGEQGFARSIDLIGLSETLNGLYTTKPHTVLQYCLYNLQLTRGIIKEFFSISEKGDTPWEKLGRYIYVLIQNYPEEYLTAKFSPTQVLYVLSEISRRGYNPDKQCIIDLVEQNKVLSYGQPLVVPFFVLKYLHDKESVKDKLTTDHLCYYVKSKFSSDPQFVDTDLLKQMIQVIRDAKTIELDTTKKATVAEREMTQLLSSRSKLYPQHSQTFGLLYNACSLIFIRNPELMNLIIFGENEPYRLAIVDHVFDVAVSMVTALFPDTSPEGKLIRGLSEADKPLYKQEIYKFIWWLKPIFSEISSGRTKEEYNQINAILSANQMYVSSDNYTMANPLIRVKTIWNSMNNVLICEILSTCAINNHAGGECWANALRTSGEARVQELIINLSGKKKYEILHVDKDGKYTSNRNEFQAVADYIIELLKANGIHYVFEHDIPSGKWGINLIPDDSTIGFNGHIVTIIKDHYHYWAHVDIFDYIDLACCIRINN